MAGPTSCKDAIAAFEKRTGVVAAQAEKVELWGQCPPIVKMDASLGTLKACKHLALSTNNIEKISSLAGLPQLAVLSLGRNCIKKLEGLDPIASTLKQLWISYNVIERLAGIEKLSGLEVLYMSNNKVRDWAEIDKLAALEQLKELLLLNNPCQVESVKAAPDKNTAMAEYRIQVIKRLPQLKKLDGMIVEVEEWEAATGKTAVQAKPAEEEQ